jgi:hypothetical protein
MKILPLSDDELGRLRKEARREAARTDKHGEWQRLVLRLLATIDAAKKAPSDA